MGGVLAELRTESQRIGSKSVYGACGKINKIVPRLIHIINFHFTYKKYIFYVDSNSKAGGVEGVSALDVVSSGVGGCE
jgi:hypothetical protein